VWTALDKRTVAVTHSIVRWFAIDGEPPFTVEKPGFKEYMLKYQPSYPGTHHSTVLARFLEFSEGFVVWFWEFQKSVDWWAATTDGLRTFTYHCFVPNTWKLVSFCLWTGPCGGTDDDIAEFLLGVIERYELPVARNVAVTTDTANAEKAGVRLAGLFRNDCGDHVLYLIMRMVGFAGKPAKNNHPAQPPSPVYASVQKLLQFGKKLQNAPKLMTTFLKYQDAYCKDQWACFSSNTNCSS
jgi:hypothetical protein